MSRIRCSKKIFDLEIQDQGQFYTTFLINLHQSDSVESTSDLHDKTFFYMILCTYVCM